MSKMALLATEDSDRLEVIDCEISSTPICVKILGVANWYLTTEEADKLAFQLGATLQDLQDRQEICANTPTR